MQVSLLADPDQAAAKAQDPAVQLAGMVALFSFGILRAWVGPAIAVGR
jgi:hypothetical protein